MKIKNIIKESIIKVPSTLLNDVNKYVASCAYYLYNLELQKASEKEAAELKSAMAFLQTKGARNINQATFNKLMHNVINLNIDYGQFFKELNYKNITPEIEQKASKYKTTLKMHMLPGEHAGSVQAYQSGDALNIEINFSQIEYANNPKEKSRRLMDTVYHELQHVVQNLAISLINPHDKQLQHHETSRPEEDVDYYSSGIEFGPLLSNLVSAIKAELEIMYEDKSLQNNKNKDIQTALSNALQKNSNLLQRNFIISLYQKNQEKYKKALKTLFKEVSPFYDTLVKEGINLEYTELPQEEIEAEINVPGSIYERLKSLPDYKVTPYGESINDLSRIVAFNKDENWTITISIRPKNYTVGMSEGDNERPTNNFVFDTYGLIDLVSLIEKRKYMDYDELEDAVESCKLSKSEEIDSNTISSMLELNARTAQLMGIPFDITSSDSFKLMDIDFTIEKASDTKIALVSDDEGIFISMRPGQFNILMYRIFVLIKMDKRDEAHLAIASNISYSTALKDLDKYQDL